MKHQYKSTNHICFLLCIALIVSMTFCFLDYSYAATNVEKTEETVLESKIDVPPKGSEFKGYIVNIKDRKIDEVSHTNTARDLPSTESDKFYLIETTEDALDLASTSAIESVAPNYIREMEGVYNPNDPDYINSSKAVYESMGIDDLWEKGIYGKGVDVAVLDTGINSHQDMTSPYNILKAPHSGSGGVIASNIGNDVNGHGTKVTSIIHAGFNNGRNIAGIAEKANITSINVFEQEDGKTYATVFQTLNAYEYLIENNTPDIMNLSYGGDNYIKAEEDLLEKLTAKGCIIIAANGNDGNSTNSTSDPLIYPAAYDCVIGVGATDRNGNIAYFSSKNSSVDVCAWGEGVKVLNSWNSSGSTTTNGTSFSAPIVSGIVACLKEIYPDLDTSKFRGLISETSTDKGTKGRDNIYGYGVINASEILYKLGMNLKINFYDRGKIATKTYSFNSKLTGMPTPSRKGYTFKGWYTAKSGGTKLTSANMVNSNKTFYAQWTAKKYKLKFKPNKGRSLKTKYKKVTYDKKMGKLPVPKRFGYKFKGWYTKKSGGKKITSKTKVKITKTTTLYAHWKRK